MYLNLTYITWFSWAANMSKMSNFMTRFTSCFGCGALRRVSQVFVRTTPEAAAVTCSGGRGLIWAIMHLIFTFVELITWLYGLHWNTVICCNCFGLLDSWLHLWCNCQSFVQCQFWFKQELLCYVWISDMFNHRSRIISFALSSNPHLEARSWWHTEQ